MPDIDVRDLGSVRRAAKARGPDAGAGQVLLGDDWIAPEATADATPETAERRRFLTLRSSPLARKIITFNLIALIVLVAGMMFLAPSTEGLAAQRAAALAAEAELIANVFEVAAPDNVPVNLTTGDGLNVRATLEGIDLRGTTALQVFGADGTLIASALSNAPTVELPGRNTGSDQTFLIDLLGKGWDLISGSGGPDDASSTPERAQIMADMLARVPDEGVLIETVEEQTDGAYFAVAKQIHQGSQVIGYVVVTSLPGELNHLLSVERENILQLFLVGVLVSIGLSIVLASTIANPLAQLAAAAEAGRDRNARKMAPGRIRIPDLTARPDEIGRLSGALRDMVAALYDRIEGNEQFAADVAHEIKNPLASLRSAVGTLRIAKRDDQREKLLEIIDHDVGRLDRLVSDISAASRLDSELVREEEEPFNLLKTVGNINEFLARDAASKGVEYISDLPDGQIMVQGLEGRLAQVFVNIITNAISFCEDGDAIRVWVRRRDNRVLVVVEDTGPGIPDEALTKIFQRFYSERPAGQFGNNSGLGLAISKQIIEAHGGVIWAENIRPTADDAGSDRLGARFVVGLPV